MAYPSAFDLELANDALTRLSESPINSFIDNSMSARTINRLYPRVRALMFASDFDWRFATARVDLGTPIAAAFPWAYEYAMPINVAKVRQILAGTNAADMRALDPRHFEEGIDAAGTNRVIRCDVQPATLVYTMEIIDPTIWDAGFVSAFTMQLAAEIALPITGNGQIANSMADAAQRAIASQAGPNQVQSVSQQQRGGSRTMQAR